MSPSIIGARRSHLCRDKLTERAQLATKIYLKLAFKNLGSFWFLFFEGSKKKVFYEFRVVGTFGLNRLL